MHSIILDDDIMRLKVKDLKKKTFEMVLKAQKGHLGGSFSSAEFLVALYYGGYFSYDSINPDWSERDVFILSKGHAHNLFYNILADVGYFSTDEIDRFAKNGSLLGGHCDKHVPGAEITTGALGHGLSIAAGLALAYKLDGKSNRVFVLLGDGECQEGSVWEALMFIAHHKLTNLIVVVDYNHLGSEDFIETTSDLAPFHSKLEAFGFLTLGCNGHSIADIMSILENAVSNHGGPVAIVLDTVKGMGLVTAGNPQSHYILPKGEDIDQCRRNLENEY